MNIRQMLEVTALISVHSAHLVESGKSIPRDALQRYWSCSTARRRIWLERFNAYPAEVAAATSDQKAALWGRTEQLLNEVFVTEIMTRVWTAVVIAWGRNQGARDAEFVVRNVFMGHQESRQRALQIMVEGPGVTLEQIAAVDCLRRRAERWTDLLLGHLTIRYGLSEFAFDVERSLDFGESQTHLPSGRQHHQVWQLYLVCLQGGFAELRSQNPLYERFRAELVRSLLGYFPTEAFHDDGPLRSLAQRIITGRCISEGPARATLQSRTTRTTDPASPPNASQSPGSQSPNRRIHDWTD